MNRSRKPPKTRIDRLKLIGFVIKLKSFVLQFVKIDRLMVDFNKIKCFFDSFHILLIALMFCFHTMAFKLRLKKFHKFIFEHNLEPQSREKLKVLSIHCSYLIPSFLFDLFKILHQTNTKSRTVYQMLHSFQRLELYYPAPLTHDRQCK